MTTVHNYSKCNNFINFQFNFLKLNLSVTKGTLNTQYQLWNADLALIKNTFGTLV